MLPDVKRASMKSGACLIFVVIILLMTCGCTGMQGTTGSVSVSSMPQGADVYIDGTLQGRTPLVLNNMSPGVHHVLIQTDGNSRYETDVQVTPRTTVTVDWVPDQGVVAPTLPANQPVFSVGNMKGYRGGGDYITSLSYDIFLAAGAKQVNMSNVLITLTMRNETIYPYWEIADKEQANTDNILESGETFFITMRTPNLGPGRTFTLMVIPETGQPYTTSQTLPAKIGLDVLF
jgi:hypothetical protein